MPRPARSRPDRGSARARLRSLVCLAAVVAVAGCGDGTDTRPSLQIVSAFFGLDDALPATVEAICPGGAGRDGMPLVLDARLAIDDLDPTAFSVVTASGARGSVRCATLLPAVGPLERRTILLVGDLGTASDPPARVAIDGVLPTERGPEPVLAAIDDVTPLVAGPRIALAERYAFAALADLLPATAGQCPHGATVQLVDTVWQGGITAAGGGAIGERERQALRVRVRDAAGAERDVVPFALGDLGDRDNHLHLCLDIADEAVGVAAEPGAFFDPGNDPNPATRAAVVAGALPEASATAAARTPGLAALAVASGAAGGPLLGAR